MAYKSNDVITAGFLLESVGADKLGYQLPLAPGSNRTGEMTAGDLGDYWCCVYGIEFSVDSAEAVFFQTNKEIPNYSNLAITVLDEEDNTVSAVSLTKGGNPTEWEGTGVAGLFSYFQGREGDLVKVLLQFT